MAAPDYPWNTITESQTDADSPLDTTLMEAMRRNIIHTKQWLGYAYTPNKAHNHDGTNSATLSDTSTGNWTSYINTAEQSTTSTSQVLLKEMKLGRGGEIRVWWGLRTTLGVNGWVQVYRNGSPVGVELVGNDDVLEDFSDITSGWSSGDLVQLYVRVTAPRTAFVANMRIAVSLPLDAGSRADGTY